MSKITIEQKADNIRKNLLAQFPDSKPFVVATYYQHDKPTLEFSSAIYSQSGDCISEGYACLSYREAMAWKKEVNHD